MKQKYFIYFLAPIVFLGFIQIVNSQTIDSQKLDPNPPVITNISVTPFSSTSVIITWTTDELSNSKVLYGKGRTSKNEIDQNDVISHSIKLENLDIATEYVFCVESRDKVQNIGQSCDHTFTTSTPIPADTTAPIITDVIAEDISTSTATISWVTNEIATGQVEYGLTSTYGLQSPYDQTLNLNHSIRLTDLTEDTTYHIQVESKDNSNNSSKSQDITFKTLKNEIVIPPSTALPIITNITSHNQTSSSVSISWTTNKITDGQIEYGINTDYGTTTNLDSDLIKHHTQIITGLEANTAYYARIHSHDNEGNEAISEDFIFQTTNGTTITPPDENPPPVEEPGDGSDNGSGGGDTNTPRDENPADATTPINNTEGVFKNGSGTIQINQVSGVTAYGLNHTILILWNKANEADRTGIKIVRSKEDYPTNPNDGDLLYQGNGMIFSDVNLTNNKTYYYSVFAYKENSIYSEPVQLSIAPVEDPSKYTSVQIDNGKIQILTTRDFGLGTRGFVVNYLQNLLASDPTLYPEGLVTGYFGPLTKSAIIRFQKRHGIPETGIVDANVRAITRDLTVPQNVKPELSPRSNMSLGSTGDNVKVLQTALVQLDYLDETFIDGNFGIETQQAVLKFQKDNNLVVDGIVGPVTRAKAILKVH
ncbi:MAG: peptidoglycan-binding protein [Patescibacteria group bacterium]